jgi:hypothetical protein
MVIEALDEIREFRWAAPEGSQKRPLFTELVSGYPQLRPCRDDDLPLLGVPWPSRANHLLHGAPKTIFPASALNRHRKSCLGRDISALLLAALLSACTASIIIGAAQAHVTGARVIVSFSWSPRFPLVFLVCMHSSR